jgi:tRNA nucleotidyltransferase (CCA-adding enzyme)
LETAVIKIKDEFIDLVNLRSEEYGEDSRVPKIKIGTPL